MKPIFDWITPLIRLGEQVSGMTVIDCTVDGWTGGQVKRELERNGVRVGLGNWIVKGQGSITVDDPRRAQEIISGLEPRRRR